MESQAQRRDLLLSFKETDIALNYLLNMFIPTWSLIQRTLSSQWTAPSARDSWLPKIPRISHSCGLSPKQDIYITHSKAQATLQKGYAGRQDEGLWNSILSLIQPLQSLTLNYSVTYKTTPVYSYKMEGLMWPYSLLLNYWVETESGKGGITAFSCVPTSESTSLQPTVPNPCSQA